MREGHGIYSKTIFVVVCVEIVSSMIFFLFFLVGLFHSKSKLYGTGSSFSHSLFQDFASNADSQDYTFEYDGEHSTCYSGINSLLNDNNYYSLIASEIDFTREEKGFINKLNKSESIKNVICLPVSVSAVVFIFKLPDLSKAQILTLKNMFSLGIYNKTYQIWNTKDIRDKNMFLPDKPIKLVFRDDESGTTYLLSKFFSQYSKKFKNKFGISGLASSWNISHPAGLINSQIDVLKYVSTYEYSIGYISFSTYHKNRHDYHDVHTSRYLTEDGENSIKCEQDAISNAVSNSDLTNSSYSDDNYELPNMNLFNMPGDNVWPYSAASYVCLLRDVTKSRADVLYRFFSDFYTFTNKEMITTSYVPIPKVLQKQSLKILKNKLRCNGKPCFHKLTMSRLVVQIATIILFCFGFYGLCIILTGFLTRRKFSLEFKTSKEEHSIEPNVIAPSQVNLRDLILEEQIGSGSFSEVYRGKWLGTEVAIKRFLVSKTNKSVFEEFRMETALLKNLRHPNIVQFLTSMITDTHLYIICEYCERGNLQSVLRNKDVKLSIRKIISFALDAARGMEYLHSHVPPILHRDFKSTNLLMSKNWTIKIADFGLSRILTKREEMSTCGTVETCAPEILSCKPYTERADVYSFGIVLFELMTRQELYPNMNFFAISKKVVEERYRPNIDEVPDSPYVNEIKELICQCWSHHSSERPDFSRIVKRLSKVYHRLDQEAREKSMKRTQSKIVIADSFEKVNLMDRFEDQMMQNNNSIEEDEAMINRREHFFRTSIHSKRLDEHDDDDEEEEEEGFDQNMGQSISSEGDYEED